jgi:hypothetical protein
VQFTQSGTGATTRTVESKLRDVVSVKDFGAVGDGVADDAPAFTSALAFSQNVRAPKGNYRLNTNITVPSNYSLVTDYGVEFSGPGVIVKNGFYMDYGVTGLSPQRTFNLAKQDIYTTDSNALTNFEIARYRVATEGNTNAIVGAAVQTGPGYGFPCGITGYGKLNHPGNQAFGVFGWAEARTPGVVTHEFNTFNFSSGPPGIFPPNRGFGITDTIPITLTVAAGGTHQSLIGVQITREGSQPNSYVCGVYMNPGAATNYGLFIDATSSTGPILGVSIASSMSTANHCAVFIQNKNASQNAGSAFMKCLDSGAQLKFGVSNTGQLLFGSGLTQSTVGVAGAASVLPSNPTGYFKMSINGQVKAIPYYES